MTDERDHHIEKTGWKEIGWFIGLWAFGVTAILVVGTVIKLVIGA